jgi:hypothetical protein
MQTNRRDLLKVAAVAPIAAGIASVPTTLVAETAAPVAAIQHPWAWYVTHDQEVYHLAGDTMAQAIEYAKRCGYGYVAECQKQDWDFRVDGDELLEMLQGRNEDRMGEDYEFIECTKEQERDLGAMVTAAVNAWVKKHGIKTTAWAFGDMRNETKIEQPEPALQI